MASRKLKRPVAKKPWQGSDWVTIEQLVPTPMRMLLALMELKLEDVLHRFMKDLFNNRNREQWLMLRDYFIITRQGQDFYTSSDIRQMIEELSAIEALWPSQAEMHIIDAHARWRDLYQKYWFEKWEMQIRRRASSK